MFTNIGIVEVLADIKRKTKRSYEIERFLASDNGMKRHSPRRTFLVYTPTSKKKAVLRISFEEPHEGNSKESKNILVMSPSIIAEGAVFDSKNIWYVLEEFVSHIKSPFEDNDHVKQFFTQYLRQSNWHIKKSSKVHLKSEIDSLFSAYEALFVISAETQTLLNDASQRYVMSKKLPTRRLVNLDLIESNILWTGKEYFIIDTEFVAQSHFAIIEFLRFNYYHNIVQSETLSIPKEHIPEYTLLSLLLPQALQSQTLSQMNTQFYQEDLSNLPFLLAIMFMYEQLLQHKVHRSPVTLQDSLRAESLLNLILSPNAATRVCQSLTQGNEGTHGNGSHEYSQTEFQYLQHSLETIQNARFYKLWQKYCRFRDKLKKLLN